jgi:hypothetical protein
VWDLRESQQRVPKAPEREIWRWGKIGCGERKKKARAREEREGGRSEEAIEL